MLSVSWTHMRSAVRAWQADGAAYCRAAPSAAFPRTCRQVFLPYDQKRPPGMFSDVVCRA